jgi:hypothetical protein
VPNITGGISLGSYFCSQTLAEFRFPLVVPQVSTLLRFYVGTWVILKEFFALFPLRLLVLLCDDFPWCCDKTVATSSQKQPKAATGVANLRNSLNKFSHLAAF